MGQLLTSPDIDLIFYIEVIYKGPTQEEYGLEEDLLNLVLLESSPFSIENINSVRKHYSNGLSRYTEKIKIETVTDVKKCRVLWQSFTANESLFDTWNFRHSFYTDKDFYPFFLVIKKDSEIVALLPLTWDTMEKRYTWFGTDWQEDNRFFAKDPLYIPLMLLLAPRPLSLESIKKSEVDKVPSFIKFSVDHSKYLLNLEDFSSIESYLFTLKKKKRYNLRRDKRKIEYQQPRIYVNRFGDYDEWVEICRKRFFGKSEKLDFDENPKNITIFKQIIKNGQNIYQPKMISVEINGELVAADINVIYKDTYYPLHGGGYNVTDYSGIGNYMNLIEIQDAINMGMKKIDFLSINYGWKDSWFPETTLFKFEAM